MVSLSTCGAAHDSSGRTIAPTCRCPAQALLPTLQGTGTRRNPARDKRLFPMALGTKGQPECRHALMAKVPAGGQVLAPFLALTPALIGENH